MNIDDILDLDDFYFLEPWPHWDEWESVHDGQHVKLDVIARLLKDHIAASEVIVLAHVDPPCGALLSQVDALNYIGSYLLEGDIQISDRYFKSFVFVSRNGVAMGWQRNEAVR
jgi:hypothetical protein